jgi:hypothetical protein
LISRRPRHQRMMPAADQAAASGSGRVMTSGI